MMKWLRISQKLPKMLQTMGRAARHADGHVIMYADTVTGGAMHEAMEET
jgi:excinuclease UvrABC helicase subunit UvrB